jgi:hypothetical protein
MDISPQELELCSELPDTLASETVEEESAPSHLPPTSAEDRSSPTPQLESLTEETERDHAPNKKAVPLTERLQWALTDLDESEQRIVELEDALERGRMQEGKLCRELRKACLIIKRQQRECDWLKATR